ncbi:phosphopantetheine-binding protein [Goodfellowiella coeruleoviolacea]|uniref:Aryl carrier domain-containing protein n=1 Tax=Goodfellowiella coeruleoviolacea TaxID=334858 RepID=A0AAE3GAQ6_9PSEU|nr:phosphopantetheine-binding protein [Goodfellowiella coeruleoviolacea]MCP2163842.1 Aryl carrier domain-containing protein [Goodfellowiella coeruleoviolacea]
MPDAAPLTRESVRQSIADVLYVPADEIGDTDDLIQSGVDSVRIMSLIERWRDAGVEVAFVELAEAPSLDRWWELLSSRQRAARQD